MRNLLLTGGPYHPFATTSRTLADLLSQAGVESVITDDVEGALRSARNFDVLTIYLLRWRMLGAMFDDKRDEWAMSLADDSRAAIVDHLARGRPLLAFHTAAVSFDDWPEWADILGARWDWERSSHPPPRPSTIRRTVEHPIVAGIDEFEVVDEIYSFLDTRVITPLLTSARRGQDQPLLWVRDSGAGRVVYDALGHDDRSLKDPIHSMIIRRACAWAIAP